MMNYIKKQVSESRGFLLGKLENGESVYLTDFEWDCGWYWGGGYIRIYRPNRKDFDVHTHFDSVFFKGDSQCIAGAGRNHHIDVVRCFSESALTEDEWWRLLDLMKQFYALRECAGVFQYGGHMTSHGRTEAELNKEMADKINAQIKDVIIPEIRKIFQ
jgi:hypothetical protein